MDIIVPIVNLICLFGLVLGIRWWQHRYGQLSEKRYSLIALGYGTFFIVTTMHPIYLETHSRIALWIELGLLVFVWTFGYAYARWLYKQFISKK
jgi:hypothetical protein